MNKSQLIHVAGGGLVGSLLTLRLLQRGYDVSLYEMRPDMRSNTISAGRSINLALSHRGIQSLRLCGVDHQILQHAIQMEGRLIHPLHGDLQLQPYSSREGEYINSISRKTLNVILLNEIEKLKKDCVHFNTKLSSIDIHKNQFIVENENAVNHSLEKGILLATDGAFSQGRKFLLEHSNLFRFNYNQRYQNYGYKELTIPPGPHGEFRIEKNVLHIWPRGHFLMIGLPNPDATFTATVFLPFHGDTGFSSILNKNSLQAFFEKYFPDSIPHLPELTGEFFENPTGQLVTVKCDPWYWEDKVLLMGDAAHAIIPFYGQGMNCGFEDVFVFDQLLDIEQNWLGLFERFTTLRKPNSDAIADLAEDNFIEMRDKVADPVFQRKRKLEMDLEKKYPDYYSKYALVTFRPDVSYFDAMVKGRKQDDMLMNFCTQHTEWNEHDLERIYAGLKEKLVQ